ncbi:transposase [Actinacidiphila glaucinigra]|uniref:transposase n=1 Tax=Actinacidiphila glaucinigra TaxID=235986 RepID=UPI0035E06A8A
MPLLYLHGLWSGDFVPALEQLLGGPAGLSMATVPRVAKQWSEDHAAFQTRDLSERDFVYVWADACTPRSDSAKPTAVSWSCAASGWTAPRN